MHCAGAMRNIRCSAPVRTVCDEDDTGQDALSVAYGRMGRMSEDRTSDSRTGAGPADPVIAELPVYAERVLDVADLVPPGRVMTYGDVAEWLGEGGPRQVGRVMALYGSRRPGGGWCGPTGRCCRATNCRRSATTARRAPRCGRPRATRTGTFRAST